MTIKLIFSLKMQFTTNTLTFTNDHDSLPRKVTNVLAGIKKCAVEVGFLCEWERDDLRVLSVITHTKI